MGETCEQAKTLRRGYNEQMDWLEWMSKRFTQTQCSKCGIWHIWKRPIKHPSKTNDGGKDGDSD